MQIVKPYAEYWANTNNLDHAIKCAKVCYASETTVDDKEQWLESKLKAGHKSIFRHQTRYYVIPAITITERMRYYFTYSPYVGYYENNEWAFVSINGQTYIENPWIHHLDKYSTCETGMINLAEELGCRKEVELILRRTLYVVTQISTSRELNRVSPNNICEQSTRYCNFTADKFDGQVAICEPWWFKDKSLNDVWLRHYFAACEIATNVYIELINKHAKPQDARGVLPLDTATKCVYTYRIEEWKHILGLRYYGLAGKPHPNAKIIANLIREELNKTFGYDYFDEDLPF